MNFTKYFSIGWILLLTMCCFSTNLFAQFDLPIDPCTDPADPCPIDDGVYFLLAAGIGAAAYKTYKYKRVNTPSIT